MGQGTERKFYTYLMRDGDGNIRYIGMGSGNRMYDPYRNEELEFIDNPALDGNRVLIREIDQSGLTQEEAWSRESELITRCVFQDGYGIDKNGYRLNDSKRYLCNKHFGNRSVQYINENDENRRMKEVSHNAVNRYPTHSNQAQIVMSVMNQGNADYTDGYKFLIDEATYICDAIIAEYFDGWSIDIRQNIAYMETTPIYKVNRQRDVNFTKRCVGKGTLYSTEFYEITANSYIYQMPIENIVVFYINAICGIYENEHDIKWMSGNTYITKSHLRLMEQCGCTSKGKNKRYGYCDYLPTEATTQFCDMYGIAGIHNGNQAHPSFRLASCGGEKEVSGTKKSSTRKYIDPKSNVTVRATRFQMIPALTGEWMLPVCRNGNDREIKIERERIQQMPKPKVIYQSDFDLLTLVCQQLQSVSTLSGDELSQVTKEIGNIVNRKYFWEEEVG